jgi:hypothetical protein
MSFSVVSVSGSASGSASGSVRGSITNEVAAPILKFISIMSIYTSSIFSMTVPLFIEGCDEPIGYMPYKRAKESFEKYGLPPVLSIDNDTNNFCVVKEYAPIAHLWLDYLNGLKIFIPSNLVGLMLSFAISERGCWEIRRHLDSQIRAHMYGQKSPYLYYDM